MEYIFVSIVGNNILWEKSLGKETGLWIDGLINFVRKVCLLGSIGLVLCRLKVVYVIIRVYKSEKIQANTLIIDKFVGNNTSIMLCEREYNICW